MKVNGNKVKKITLLMALLAPMIYLFGSLFEALKGANGEQVFAQQEEIVIDERAVDFNQLLGRSQFVVTRQSGEFVLENNYGAFSVYASSAFIPTYFVALSSVNLVKDHVYLFSTSAVGPAQGSSSWNLYLYDRSSGTYAGSYIADYALFTPSVDTIVDFRAAFYSGFVDVEASFYLNCFDLSQMYPSNPVAASLLADYSLGTAYAYTASRIDYFPVAVVPDYTQFIFSQFFYKNNFLAQSGRKVIEGAPDYGFAPAGDMIRFIDGNMFHLANVEYGLLVIGYTYYAFHVVCVFLIFNLLMFFPHLIENIYEKFERGW